jgi:uncharacterized protein (DUF1330 family)
VRRSPPSSKPAHLGACRRRSVDLARVGARIRSGGADPSFIIGDGDRPWWDAIIVVEYPSPSAFLQMVSNPEYATINEHRVAALDRAELIATSVWSDNT